LGALPPTSLGSQSVHTPSAGARPPFVSAVQEEGAELVVPGDHNPHQSIRTCRLGALKFPRHVVDWCPSKRSCSAIARGREHSGQVFITGDNLDESHTNTKGSTLISSIPGWGCINDTASLARAAEQEGPETPQTSVSHALTNAATNAGSWVHPSILVS
jgi:hypothetical protein